MPNSFLDDVTNTLNRIEADGLYKRERLITSAQAGTVSANGRYVINLCANNYLGLANDPALIAAAQTAMDKHGYGVEIKAISYHQLLVQEGPPAHLRVILDL